MKGICSCTNACDAKSSIALLFLWAGRILCCIECQPSTLFNLISNVEWSFCRKTITVTITVMRRFNDHSIKVWSIFCSARQRKCYNLHSCDSHFDWNRIKFTSTRDLCTYKFINYFHIIFEKLDAYAASNSLNGLEWLANCIGKLTYKVG